jgi:hypothetical protein
MPFPPEICFRTSIHRSFDVSQGRGPFPAGPRPAVFFAIVDGTRRRKNAGPRIRTNFHELRIAQRAGETHSWKFAGNSLTQRPESLAHKKIAGTTSQAKSSPRLLVALLKLFRRLDRHHQAFGLELVLVKLGPLLVGGQEQRHAGLVGLDHALLGLLLLERRQLDD